MPNLAVRPRHAFSTNWLVEAEGAALAVAEIRLSRFRSAGEIVVGVRRYEIRRHGWLRGAYTLLDDGGLMAVAADLHWWSNRVRVQCGHANWELAPRTWFSHAYTLREGEREIGRIRPLYLLSSGLSVELPDAIPLPVQVFLAWIVLERRERSAATAAATAAAAPP